MRAIVRDAVPVGVLALIVASCSGSSDSGSGPGPIAVPDSGSDANPHDAANDATDDGPPNEAGVEAGTDAEPADAADDPCPTLTIPTSCYGRDVIYREWGADATGDGSYFASQAPQRLGFTRVQNGIWIVKIQTEDNTYLGDMSAYGDSVGGVAWISDKPCDATFAIDNGFVAYGNHGGGTMHFIVVRTDADEQALDTDPAYSKYSFMHHLRGNHCYYVSFENAVENPTTPLTTDYFANATDTCGAGGDGTCYYLAMDFGHRLHDIVSGALYQGNVIDGLTVP